MAAPRRTLLVSAFVGSENLGDEAIFASILANLRLDDVTVMATTVDAGKTEQLGVVPVPMKGPLRLFRAVRAADVVLMGGGGIIQDQSSLLNMLLYGYQLWLARALHTPVVLCFVGVGPLRSPVSRFILRRAAPAVRLAVVRDEESAELLREVVGGAISEIQVHHDPVLNHPVPPGDGTRSDVALVSLRKWFFSIPLLPAKVARKINSLGIRRRRYDRFVTVLARELDAFLDATPEATLRFVSFYDSEDLEVTVDVIGRMRHQDRITPPEPRLTSHDYVAMARDARVVFGMRLHSLILASVAGTPFAAVDYSPKVGAFARQMGQDAYAEPVTAFAEGTLARAFTRAWADAHANAPVIARHHDAFAESNRQAFARIQELLDQAG